MYCEKIIYACTPKNDLDKNIVFILSFLVVDRGYKIPLLCVVGYILKIQKDLTSNHFYGEKKYFEFKHGDVHHFPLCFTLSQFFSIAFFEKVFESTAVSTPFRIWIISH